MSSLLSEQLASKEEGVVVRLNLGSGAQKIPGYRNVDRAFGQEVYPLTAYADGSVDEIRASHILEHFSHRDVPQVLADWVRALKPGGCLKIAVPNYEWIAEQSRLNIRLDMLHGYLMGGQVDENDYHKSAFNHWLLQKLLQDVGLVDVEPWQSEINDCASLPVSLNLMGRKAVREERAEALQAITVAALSSVPRLAFGAHCKVAQRAMGELGIELFTQTGAFWEMPIQNGLTALIEQGKEYALLLDYDTIFESGDVKELLRLAAAHPEADALIPWQSRRGGKNGLLFSVKDEVGKNRLHYNAEEFEQAEITPVSTGHFGLTLLKLSALRRVPKPWFWSTPNPENGEWDAGHVPADIYFWKKFAEFHCAAFLANTVKVGHHEEFITWVDGDFRSVTQPLSEWHLKGKPEGCR